MSKPDERAIERDYCAGVLSQQDVADKYGITLKALRYRANKHGWIRIKVPALGRVKSGAKKGKKSGAKNAEICPKKNAPKIALISDGRESLSAIKNIPEFTRRQDIDLTFDPEEFGLTEKEAYYVFYFMRTDNKAEAYRQAGYKSEAKTPYSEACKLHRKPGIQRALRELRDRFRKKFNADVDLLVDQLMAIITADPNEIVQYRRVNCRHCWGENYLYQWRDIQEFDKAAAKALKDSRPEPEYGGLGFIDSLDPNPDCPKCAGEGIGSVHINDTRDLESKAHKLYAGIKEGKFGIEVLTEDKKSARLLLTQMISKFDLNNNSDNIPTGLDDFYADVRKTKPESGATGILGDSGEE